MREKERQGKIKSVYSKGKWLSRICLIVYHGDPKSAPSSSSWWPYPEWASPHPQLIALIGCWVLSLCYWFSALSLVCSHTRKCPHFDHISDHCVEFNKVLRKMLLFCVWIRHTCFLKIKQSYRIEIT